VSSASKSCRRHSHSSDGPSSKSRGTCVSVQRHANLRFGPVQSSACGVNDRSRGRRRRPHRLRPRGRCFEFVVGRMRWGEKALSQQQSNGFPHEGTTHRRILLQKLPQITQISAIPTADSVV
jgi:hypothetical protein